MFTFSFEAEKIKLNPKTKKKCKPNKKRNNVILPEIEESDNESEDSEDYGSEEEK